MLVYPIFQFLILYDEGLNVMKIITISVEVIIIIILNVRCMKKE